MALFNFGKKKEETHASAKAADITSGGCPEAANVQRCFIRVLGAGCRTCHQQYEYVKTAVAAMGLDAEAEYITDMEKVMTYGVMSLPALVVNGRVISTGKLLRAADVENLLHKLGF